MLLKHEKKSLINKIIDYIFEIYNVIPLIACSQFSLILTRRCPKQPMAKASKMVSGGPGKDDVAASVAPYLSTLWDVSTL